MTETICLRSWSRHCACVCACSEPEVQEHLRNVYTVTALAILSTAAGAYFPIFENIRLVSLIKSVCIEQKSQPWLFTFIIHVFIHSFIDRILFTVDDSWLFSLRRLRVSVFCAYLLFYMSKLVYLEQNNFSHFINLLNTDSLIHCFPWCSGRYLSDFHWGGQSFDWLWLTERL